MSRKASHPALASLADDLRDLLLEISLAPGSDLELWREAWAGEPGRWQQLLELRRKGDLLVPGRGGTWRLAAGLAAALAEERGKAWPEGRVERVHRRLGLAAYGLDRPAVALAHFLAAGDLPRLARLVVLEPDDLIRRASPDVLAAALAGLRGEGSWPEAEARLAALVEGGAGAAPAAEAAGAGTVFWVQLFGTPTVARDGQELAWPLKRAFKILAFLATSPALRASKEDLIEALWSEEDQEKIARNFHPTLSHLRRALAGADQRRKAAPLLRRPGGLYQLDPAVDWRIDAVDFPRLVEEGRQLRAEGKPDPAVTAWRSAWRSYRGPLLATLYDPWVLERRETYHRLYLEVLRDLGDLCRELGRLDEALDAYRAALFDDPLQERIHTSIMEIYAGQGRRDLVRRQYERLAHQLRQELGVEPMRETTDQYHSLLR